MLGYLKKEIERLNKTHGYNNDLYFYAGQIKAYQDIYDKLIEQESFIHSQELSETSPSYEEAKDTLLECFKDELTDDGIDESYYGDIYIKIAFLDVTKDYRKDHTINEDGFDENGNYWSPDWNFLVDDYEIKEIL